MAARNQVPLPAGVRWFLRCRGALYMRPTAPPGSPGLQSSHPGPGGMWACRPTPLAGGAVGIAGLPGRIYNPPLQTRLLPFPAVGAHCICAHAAPPGSPGLQSSHPGPGGMWACRPTPLAGGAVGIAGLVGRIYNPPLQTRLLPFPAVGAHCICAHAAPPGSPGLQSSHPGPGGMWACRPTPLAGGAVGIAGLFGRIYNPGAFAPRFCVVVSFAAL